MHEPPKFLYAHVKKRVNTHILNKYCGVCLFVFVVFFVAGFSAEGLWKAASASAFLKVCEGGLNLITASEMRLAYISRCSTSPEMANRTGRDTQRRLVLLSNPQRERNQITVTHALSARICLFWHIYKKRREKKQRRTSVRQIFQIMSFLHFCLVFSFLLLFFCKPESSCQNAYVQTCLFIGFNEVDF